MNSTFSHEEIEALKELARERIQRNAGTLFRSGTPQETPTSVRLDSGLWEALMAYRDAEGIGRSEAMNRALEILLGAYPESSPRPKQRKRKTRSFAEIERNKMTNSIRYDIMFRDDFSCVLCGATGDKTQLHVDHIHPISRGGKTIMKNLRTLCAPCNLGEAAKYEGDF